MRLCYSSAAKWFVTPDWSNCFEMGYIIYNYRARGGAAGLRFHLPQVHPHVEITLILGHFKEGPLALPRIQAPSLPCEPKGTRKPGRSRQSAARGGGAGPGEARGVLPGARGVIPPPPALGQCPRTSGVRCSGGICQKENIFFFASSLFFSFFLGFALKKGTQTL